MTTLGVDVSVNQPVGLPWLAWKNLGVQFAIVRSSIGYLQDGAYPKHLEQAAGVGMWVTQYHTLFHHDSGLARYDPGRQVDTFIQTWIPDWRGPAALDVEMDGIDEPYLREFCDKYDAATTRPLMIYTAKGVWERLIGHNQTRYAKYLPWIASYGPGTPTSTPPVGPWPTVPDTWSSWAFWQFAGNNGRLPPYAGNIDLDVWHSTPDELGALFLSFGGPHIPPAIAQPLVAHINKAMAELAAAKNLLG